ncbi:MAG: STAS domain-containing protein [Planctomycetota bacterium]
MRIQLRQQGDVDVLVCAGEFDGQGARDYEKAIEPLIQAYRTRLVLDFEGLEYLDSRGLQSLIRTHNLVRPMGGGQVVAAPNRFVKTVIKTTGIDGIVPIYATPDDACRSFDEPDGVQPDDLSDVPIDDAVVGRIELAFGLQGRPEREATGRVVSMFEAGLTFRYPLDGGDAPIDESELQIGQEIWMRMQGIAFAPERTIKLTASISFAYAPQGGTWYRVRFKRVEAEDLVLLNQCAGANDAQIKFRGPVSEETTPAG